MMTAAYMKAAIDRNYGGANSNYATRVYTIGMGITELTGDEWNLARVTLNPDANLSDTSNSMARDITQAWDTYIGVSGKTDWLMGTATTDSWIYQSNNCIEY